MGGKGICAWNDAKAASNLAKHGLAFTDLANLFENHLMVVRRDLRRDYGEPRFNALVEFDWLVVNITFTPRSGRFISFRPGLRTVLNERFFLMRKHAKPVAASDSDWPRLVALTEQDIEAMAKADADNPATTKADWANAVIGSPPPKTAVNAKFDVDIVDWFKSQGRGYQSRMNAVLRHYMETHRKAG